MTNEELVYLYQNGDKQALEKLLDKNKGIVNKIANKFYIEGINSIDREDLEQEGYIGLITAVEKYDLKNEKKAQFITYAVYWINQRISRYIRTRNTNDETSLNTPVNENGDTELLDYIEGIDYSFENIEDKLYNQQLRRELEEVMNNSNTLRERNIIKLHYGWDSNICVSLRDISEIFNVTPERVRQIEVRGLRKIRASKWGRLKAKEIFLQRRQKSFYSIGDTVDNISFAHRYLSEVI